MSYAESSFELTCFPSECESYEMAKAEGRVRQTRSCMDALVFDGASTSGLHDTIDMISTIEDVMGGSSKATFGIVYKDHFIELFDLVNILKTASVADIDKWLEQQKTEAA